MIIIFLLSITGYCYYLNKKLGLDYAISPIFYVATSISILYISAFFGCLEQASVLIHSLGVLLFAGCLFNFYKTRDVIFSNINKSYIIFIICAILLFLANHNTYLHSVDEFSHWGLASKEIFLTNSLVKADSFTVLKDYPPGTSLFHYHVSKILGFSEGGILYAQALVILSSVLILFKNINKFNRALITITILFSYFIIFSIDQVVGFFTAAALILYYFSNRSYKDVLLITPVLFCLPILKAVGMLMAVIVVISIAVDKLIISRKYCPVNILALVIMISAVIGSQYSWKQHLVSINAQKTFSTEFSINNFINS